MLHNYNFLISTNMQGGIISAALGLIKEKEKQGDKAMERLHDGFNTQMELTANQGSWTGDQSSPAKVVEKKEVVKEKVRDPEEEKDETASAATPPGASSDDDDEKKEDVAGMGIFDLAQGASK